MRWIKGLRHDRRDGQIIDNGLVWCPARAADVTIERCLSCGAYRDIVVSGDLELLVCRPVRRDVPSFPMVP